MKIAYVSATMRLGQDGVSRCVHRMMEGAVQRGHEVIGVASSASDGEMPVPIFRVSSIPIPLQKTYRMAVPGAQGMSRYLRDFEPDIIHVNSPCTLGYAAAQWAHRNGVPVAGTYHTHFPSYPRYYRMRGFEELAWMLTRRFYNNLDRTFVPTRPVLAELQEHGVTECVYLPNGVDLGHFHPSHRSDRWRSGLGGDNSPVLLFVSRLVWEKDLRVLAETYAMLRESGRSFRMVVVGEGPARTELEAMMPDALFLGYRAGAELSAAFASSDIFVFPSTTETFGLVTLEAMASGLVPVAAAQGGAVELIEDGINGLLAAPREAADLARGIGRLLDNPLERERMAKNASASAVAYDWNTVLASLFAAYEEMIGTQDAKQRRAA